MRLTARSAILRCSPEKTGVASSPNAAGTAESRTRRRTTAEIAAKRLEPPPEAPEPHRSEGGELFIVDNSDSEWKGLKYLQDWTEIANAFDIASGFFEIGSLLALDGRWQQLEKIRVLLGAEMSARTRQALLEGLKQRTEQILDQSIEEQKEQNDFLNGVPAIVDGIRSGKIECKVYAKKKFHAKAYITHPKVKVIGSVALVGSSNFTVPGLTENVELNIQVRAPGDVEKLQKWFERYWEEGEPISDDIIRVLQRQIAEVYAVSSLR